MKQDYTHEFYVTRKCTKYEYFTVRANSMEEAKEEAENGFDYYDFDWEEMDYETRNKIRNFLYSKKLFNQINNERLNFFKIFHNFIHLFGEI